jgi:two-component system chemotaxis response regulator CheB
MGKRRADQPIRVLVVDATRARRALMVRLLRGDGRFAVAGTAAEGPAGLDAALRLRPDLIVMDVRLPVLDGYEVTRQIMQRCPTPIVLMSNSAEDAQRRSVEALSAGALAIVRKPDRRTHDHSQLLSLLRLMADVPVVTRHSTRWLPPEPRQPATRAMSPPSGDTGTVKPATPPGEQHAYSRPGDIATSRVLAIAASTGGPAALQTLLSNLGASMTLSTSHNGAEAPAPAPPVLIAQHISRGFVQALADWLGRTTALPIHVAEDGQNLVPGHVYLASDGQHLMATQPGVASLRPSAEHDRYCPSADILFESVAHVYGPKAIGVVLTGMGDDGARGLWALHRAGGQTFAQDEASSVVYGMPGAAVAAGAVMHIAPLDSLADQILLALQGENRG